jgi:SAM-dependent methyltransferase
MTAEPLTFTKRVRQSLRTPYFLFANHVFDPIGLMSKVAATARAVPVYAANLMRYSRANRRASMGVTLRHAWFHTYDRFASAGSVTAHYFWQDLWAAQTLHDRGVTQHVDVGSRLDGFIAHVLPFSEVTYVDIRPLDVDWPGFHVRQGSILSLPFESDSVPTLSCLHVIEHIGLGRYGDPVDPEGPWKAARELARVLAPGGMLLIGVPTGAERVCFDAHRIFAPATILGMFDGLTLEEFSFITDRNQFVRNHSLDDAARAYYGCGLYRFTKPQKQVPNA